MAPLKRNPGTRLQHRQRTAGSEPWCSAHPKTRPWHLCLRHRRCTAASKLWGGVRAQGPSCRQNFRAQACLLTLTCILISSSASSEHIHAAGKHACGHLPSLPQSSNWSTFLLLPHPMSLQGSPLSAAARRREQQAQRSQPVRVHATHPTEPWHKGRMSLDVGT